MLILIANFNVDFPLFFHILSFVFQCLLTLLILNVLFSYPSRVDCDCFCDSIKNFFYFYSLSNLDLMIFI